MIRNSRKNSDPEIAEHVEALGPLLVQLREHLTESAGKQGTYADYVRLIDFYRESSGNRAREIIVTWVDPERPDPEKLGPEKAA
jgi:hypothetical protein